MGLVDNLPGMAYRCRNDRDWTMEFVSAGAEELTGYNPSALVHSETVVYGDLIHPDDRDEVWKQVQRSLEEGDRFRITYRIRTASGETKWVWEQGRGVFADDGELQYLEGFIIDATDREEAEERFRRVFDASPMGMYLYELDPEQNLILTDANRSADRILGVAHDSLLGLTIEDAFPGLVETEVPDKYRALAAEGGAWEAGEIPYEHGDIEGAFEVSAFQTVPGRVAVMFRDITEQKTLERQLRQAQKMESVGQLAGGVAHDFNNLLTGITGYIQLTLGTMDPDEPQVADLRKVRELADRAASLTRQLLAFSRRQELEIKVLNLNTVIEEFSKMLKRIIGEDLETEFSADPDLGNVRADPHQMEQVLVNLAVNARDAMPEGGRLTIETANEVLDEDYCRKHATATPGRYVMLAVTDTGYGMDEETRKRIFEPFFTTKGLGEGTGLGLATVYGIVKQHEGNIWVYSEPDKGTTFKVYLPRVEEEAEEIGPKDEAAPAGREGETILIVEDQEDVRIVARRGLEGQGYRVLVAASPSEAEELFSVHSGEIDLLLTDVVMPEADGPTLYRKLSEQNRSLKVLYMSGYAAKAASRNGVLEPGAAFITKPFDPSQLARRVRQVLDE